MTERKSKGSSLAFMRGDAQINMKDRQDVFEHKSAEDFLKYSKDRSQQAKDHWKDFRQKLTSD